MVDDKDCPTCGAVMRWKNLKKPMCQVCDDKEFEDRVVKKATKTANGWDVRFVDGWSFYVPLTDSVVIKPGDTVRMYGKGIGYGVRGLVLGDKVIYYRSEAAEEVYQKEQRFGATAAAPAAQAACQYLLPDNLYDSKDWRESSYAGRVEWLHQMYESKKQELDSMTEQVLKAPAVPDVVKQRDELLKVLEMNGGVYAWCDDMEVLRRIEAVIASVKGCR